MSSRFPFPSFLLGVLLAFVVGSSEAEPFSPDSPEHQALLAAGPALADEEFTLRQDYWKGTVTTQAGRAMRLQFFKRNIYGLFFGVAPESLPPGAKLHLHIFDAENEEVATVSGDPGEVAVAVRFENKVKSGLFLVLMSIEVPPGPLADAEVPAVLFYGWK